MPSLQPLKAPSSTQPSILPTISGFVSTITASASISEELNQNTIQNYIIDIAEIYGVGVDEVAAETVYTSSGSLIMAIPRDIPISEAQEVVAISVAESLGIHPSNIQVIADAESGEVHFTVTSPSFEEAAGVQFDLENGQRSQLIIEAIEDALPLVSVEGIIVLDDIGVTIQLLVDANNAENDLTQSAYQSEQLFSNLEFDVTVQSNLFFSKLKFDQTFKCILYHQ